MAQDGGKIEIAKLDRLLLKPAEAADLMGIGRTSIYELIKSGEIASVKIMDMTRIPYARLVEYIERNTTGGK